LPILTSLEEVNEALARAQAIPKDERTASWWAITNSLLDQRRELQMQQATAALGG
jgi:hypothetical protein